MRTAETTETHRRNADVRQMKAEGPDLVEHGMDMRGSRLHFKGAKGLLPNPLTHSLAKNKTFPESLRDMVQEWEKCSQGGKIMATVWRPIAEDQAAQKAMGCNQKEGSEMSPQGCCAWKDRLP